MPRSRRLFTLLAALGLLLVAAPAPAGARSREIQVPLPSAGDITVAHVVFTPKASRARRLPRFRFASASTKRLLRRYRVAVVGGSFRLSRRQVVGSVLLMRRRGSGRRTPRTAAAHVLASAGVASATVERNAIRDLRRERARASGEEANAPTACGETGLFTLLSGDTLPQGGWSFGLYYNDWDRVIDFDDVIAEHDPAEWSRLLTALGYGVACGNTLFHAPDLQASYDDFLRALGAPAPGPGCLVFTSYIGPATDSEGHVLSQPSVDAFIRCDAEINAITFMIPGHTPIRCVDSAGHDCVLQGNAATFPFAIPPFEGRSFGLTTDPPLERGNELEILIETDRGNEQEHQVM